ncbi:hypothetical protein NX059_009160 [Plenodomus lindquistii]|nr:hypothetical protein NX059_009160 [Plenodomus lindquistii]
MEASPPWCTIQPCSNLNSTNLLSEPNHIFQLAPIREPTVEQDAPASVAMSRRPSGASYTSSNYSGYNLSRSNSPTSNNFLEPGYDSSSPVNRAAMHTAHFIRPRQTTATSTPSKVVRKKRTDRKQFSRLGNSINGGVLKFDKEQGEAGRRYDHSIHFALHERILRSINPNLPQVAYQGKGQKPGWTNLKSNNRSEDVMETRDENGEILLPLSVNKNNIFASSYQVIVDSGRIIDSCYDLYRNLEAEAQALSQESSKEELLAFVCKIRDSGAAAKIASSSAQRGALGFGPPFFHKFRSLL